MRPRHRAPFLAALLVTAAAAAFLPVLRNGFSGLDDPSYITANDEVRQGLTSGGLTWAFTTFHAANWHPLTWISHMLDVTVFGLDPRGHHLSGMLLHAAAMSLLFLVLRSMTGSAPRSFAAALLWGVHPLRSESVAWAAERKDVLAAFLWMATMAAWVWRLRRPSAPRYLTALAAFALGLLAKPTLVTLPFVMLLADWWPLGRWRSPLPHPVAGNGGGPGLPRLIVEKAPFLLLAAVSSWVTFSAQRAGGMVKPLASLPLAERLANAPVACVAYLAKTFWPAGLYLPYPYPPGGTPVWETAGAAIMLLAATAWVSTAVRRLPFLALGWFWYLGTLVPVIGLVQVADQSMADRYTYLPAAGLAVALVWGVSRAAGRPGRGRVLAAAAALAAASLGMVTRHQVGLWRDDETLFRHAVRVNPANYMALTNLGATLLGTGRSAEAAELFREALRLRPDYTDALFNEGLVFMAAGDEAAALARFLRVLDLLPGDPDANLNAGVLMARQGRLPEAMERYRAVLGARPEDVEALTNMGLSLEELGRAAEALGYLREAARLEPGGGVARDALRRLEGGRPAAGGFP